MKYYIITYGCQMNWSDSERIATTLEKINYKPAPNIEGADLIIVNMCSVRQSAVDRVNGIRPRFKELKKENKKLKTILTGCVLKENLKSLNKSFDYILSIKSLPSWPEFLKEKACIDNFNEKENKECPYLKIESKYKSNFSISIPIMTGCNNFCTYCVVPHTRGPETSRSVQDILDEVKKATKNNVKEIWLLGQNVNSYSPIPFAKLLRKINDIPGDFWIRFTSSHPKDFSDELIETIGECEKVTNYLNLPIQSGDNEILKRMNRPYKVEDYKKIIKKIRKKIPNITLSTDIIVGFPGETKKEFQNTINLLNEIKFDMGYISKYSSRQGTASANFEDNVSPKEKKHRKEKLTEVLRKTSLENNKKYTNKEVEVLVEKTRNDFLIGKTKTYKTIKLNGSEKLIGTFVKVRVINALSWGLKGKLI